MRGRSGRKGSVLSWAMCVHEENPHKPKVQLVSPRGNWGSERKDLTQGNCRVGLRSRCAGTLHHAPGCALRLGTHHSPPFLSQSWPWGRLSRSSLPWPRAAAVLNILFIPVQFIFVSGFKWSAPQSIWYCPHVGIGQLLKDTS